MNRDTNAMTRTDFDVEQAVLSRYKAGARQVEPGLCCPTEYDPALLELLPREICENDYGCGDPSRYAGPGETVLDLGSGAGKICYMLAQRVGRDGRVIGVDFNDAMLALARKYQDQMAARLGFANVVFRKGRIQDLALDLEQAEMWLKSAPVRSVEDLLRFESHCQVLRREQPMVGDDSVDLVVSNCVLNLVRGEDKTRLFAEIFRVLKRGGRAVISDIVCDEEPTAAILNDPGLWSGCISGAFREDVFPAMFERAGFYGVEILARQSEPWQIIDGIEFRSMTIRAFKGKDGPCLERNQAVVYKGPWKQVRDDDGHVLNRGQRVAVCDKTFNIYTSPNGPYAAEIVAVPPLEAIPLDQAQPFDCKRSEIRDPRQSKGTEYRATVRTDDGPCCGPDGCC
jgi:ubiquinone/menaquinone biosynthesis C-methylase UbiE